MKICKNVLQITFCLLLFYQYQLNYIIKLNKNLIKSIARNIVFPITIKLGLQKVLIKKTNGILNIYFHGVSPKDFTFISGRHMQLQQFEDLLKYLIKHFQIIDLETSFKMQKPSMAKENFISISFDDGYLNNYKYLPAILSKYKVPITIFTCGVAFEKEDFLMWTDQIALMRYFLREDFVEIENEKYYKSGPYDLVSNKGVSLYNLIKKMGPNIREPFLKKLNDKYKTIEQSKAIDEDYWKLMNAKQVKELQNTGLFHFASHGMYHYNLANIRVEEAHKDLYDASKLLQQITGKKINAISFPDGSYNKDVIEQSTLVGYEHLWVSSYNTKFDAEHPALRARFGISSTTNHYSNIISIHKAFNTHGI